MEIERNTPEAVSAGLKARDEAAVAKFLDKSEAEMAQAEKAGFNPKKLAAAKKALSDIRADTKFETFANLHLAQRHVSKAINGF